MKFNITTVAAPVFVITLLSGVVFADGNQEGKDITDRVIEMGKVHDSIERDKVRESMRDKTHDRRVRVNDKTSVGGDVKGGVPEVNVKITTP